MNTHNDVNRSGFSLVEVVFAMLLMSVGLLGMAGTTTTLVHQTNISALKTHPALAMQQGIERVLALPSDSISSGSDSLGVFTVSWSMDAESDWAKTVQIVTVGPGLVSREGAPPAIQHSVPDTVDYRVLRP